MYDSVCDPGSYFIGCEPFWEEMKRNHESGVAIPISHMHGEIPRRLVPKCPSEYAMNDSHALICTVITPDAFNSILSQSLEDAANFADGALRRSDRIVSAHK